MTTLAFTLHFLARYLHIVCVTALVGGTLFYEMVVPVAIDDLRPEAQLLVFARARWVFKWIVWLSAAIIIVTGIVSTWSHWSQYSNEQLYALRIPPRVVRPPGMPAVVS